MSVYRGKTALITGGAGFIGSHLAEKLLALGCKVVVMDDLSGGFKENIPEKAKFYHSEITDKDVVSHAFKTYKPNYVFHLAAYAAEGLSHFIRHYNYSNNILGSALLINESIRTGVERFIFTSSIAAYGDPVEVESGFGKQMVRPFREDMGCTPMDPYGIAKLAVEQDLSCAKKTHDLDYTIFRPHNVYGPRQNIADRYRNVVGIFMNQIMQGKPLTIFGDGTQVRAFSYIDEVIDPMVRCLELPCTVNKTYNIGGSKEYTVNQLAAEVMNAFGSRADISYLPARHEGHTVTCDHSRASRDFGPVARTPLSIGLKKMKEWALKKGPQKTKLFTEIELFDGMPESWKKEFDL